MHEPFELLGGDSTAASIVQQGKSGDTPKDHADLREPRMAQSHILKASLGNSASVGQLKRSLLGSPVVSSGQGTWREGKETMYSDVNMNKKSFVNTKQSYAFSHKAQEVPEFNIKVSNVVKPAQTVPTKPNTAKKSTTSQQVPKNRAASSLDKRQRPGYQGLTPVSTEEITLEQIRANAGLGESRPASQTAPKQTAWQKKSQKASEIRFAEQIMH